MPIVSCKLQDCPMLSCHCLSDCPISSCPLSLFYCPMSSGLSLKLLPHLLMLVIGAIAPCHHAQHQCYCPMSSCPTSVLLPHVPMPIVCYCPVSPCPSSVLLPHVTMPIVSAVDLCHHAQHLCIFAPYSQVDHQCYCPVSSCPTSSVLLPHVIMPNMISAIAPCHHAQHLCTIAPCCNADRQCYFPMLSYPTSLWETVPLAWLSCLALCNSKVSHSSVVIYQSTISSVLFICYELSCCASESNCKHG